ncbi:MAG: FtsQ-type POTRA domain-containing protein [Fibrobacter sp.]|nr:FtsQ-type POTRA domain-containing protein [Fibrobacter sp.]
MSKRKGANNRKKASSRKASLRKGFRKSLPKALLTMLVCGAVGGLFFAGLLGYSELKIRLENSSLLNVKRIAVEGNTRISSENVIARCGLKPGMKLYSVKKGAVQAAVSADPWVKSVKVIRKLRGDVIIKIAERKPFALVNNGLIMQADPDGVLLPITKGAASTFPLFSGLRDTLDGSGQRVIVAEDMKRVKSFLELADRSESRLLSRLSQIDFSEQYRIRMVIKGFPTVIDIGVENIIERLNQMAELEGILSAENPFPARINLCYQNLAFVTQGVETTEEKAAEAVR